MSKQSSISKPSGILIEAHNIINGARLTEYGDTKTCCTNIAAQWALFMKQKHGVDVPISAQDVCWMMADLKKVRQMAKHKRDNVMDAAGYLGMVEKVL